jgi:tetratricopeptide (TPR) repeat protein
MKKDRFSSFIDRRILKPIESAPYSWGHWIVIILMSVAVRNLLESTLEIPHIIGIASEPMALRTVEENFFHLPFFYLVVFFYLIILLKLCSGESITKVTKAIATFSPVIILPPILDTILFHFRGFRLLYPTEFQQIFVIITRGILNPFEDPVYGVSPGMRQEVILGCLASGVYVFIKRRNIFRALLALFLTLIGSSFIGGIPALIAQISAPILKIHSNNLFSYVYYGAGLISSPVRKWGLVMLGIFTIELIIWYLLYNRQAARRLLATFFSLAGWAYALVLVSGFVIGLGILRHTFTTLFSNIYDFFAPVTLVVIGLLFNTVQKLSRSVYGGSGQEDKDEKTILLVSTILLLYFSLCLGYTFLLLMLFALGLLWMYQIPPLSLNRFFPASTFFWASIIMALALAGFSLFGSTRSMIIFPWRLLFWITLAGIPALSVKDFYDPSPGFNLRTLLGLRIGRIIAGVLLALTLAATPLILQRPQLLPFALILAPVSFALFFLFPKDPKPLIGCAMLFTACLSFVLYRNPILNEPELQPEFKALGSYFDGERYSEIAATSDPQLQADLYRKAIQNYTTVLANDPLNFIHAPSVNFRLGLAYMGLNQYYPAALEFQKAYEATKLSPLAHLTRGPIGGALGLVYFKLGQEAESKAVYDELAKEGRDLGKVYYQLAILEKRKGRLDAAERDFFYAVLLGDMIDEGLSHLAAVRQIKGDIPGAERLYKRAIFYNPPQISFYMNLGSLYWENKRFTEAESIYRKALTFDARNPVLYNNLAMAIDAQGRWEQAINYFSRSIQLNPAFTDAYLNLAVVFERLGMVERARLVLTDALRVEPNNYNVQTMLKRLSKKQLGGG